MVSRVLDAHPTHSRLSQSLRGGNIFCRSLPWSRDVFRNMLGHGESVEPRTIVRPKNDTDCAARAACGAGLRGHLGQFTDEPVDCLTLPATWPVAGDVGSVSRNVVTPSKKLFLAATLVAAGYGMAALLARPIRDLGPMARQSEVLAVEPSRQHLRHSPTMDSPMSDHGRERPSVAGPSTASADRVPQHRHSCCRYPTLRRPADTGAAANDWSAVPPEPEPAAAFVSNAAAPTLKNEAPRPLPIADRTATPVSTGSVDATAYTPNAHRDPS